MVAAGSYSSSGANLDAPRTNIVGDMGGKVLPWPSASRSLSDPGSAILSLSLTGDQPHLECGGNVVPWLSSDSVMLRKLSMGLNSHEVTSFVNGCEFVSLGCFCGVTRALQCLDLTRRSYPFDWVRSDAAGVLRCLQNGFYNFASSTFSEKHVAARDNTFYGGSSWGGSFWHHNPHDVTMQKNFARRIQRFNSLDGEVPASIARVFLISLNSSADLLLIPEVLAALQDMLPAAKIYLLVFIDNQSVQGPLRLPCHADQNVIFYRLGEELFADAGQQWSEQRHAEMYAEGLAIAIHAWAGSRGGIEAIPEVADMHMLHEQCAHFCGGDPSKELYWPRRVTSSEMPMKCNRGKEIDVCSLFPWPLNKLWKH